METLTNAESKKSNLLYIYASKDEPILEELVKNLTIFKKKGLIDNFYSKKISENDSLKKESFEDINQAEVILFLVSSNFLVTDFCYDSEITKILKKHKQKEAIVIPIILSPCLWKKFSFSKLQALPKNGKELTTWSDQDEAWLNISEGIIQAIKRVEKL